MVAWGERQCQVPVAKSGNLSAVGGEQGLGMGQCLVVGGGWDYALVGPGVHDELSLRGVVPDGHCVREV